MGGGGEQQHNLWHEYKVIYIYIYVCVCVCVCVCIHEAMEPQST